VSEGGSEGTSKGRLSLLKTVISGRARKWVKNKKKKTIPLGRRGRRDPEPWAVGRRRDNPKRGKTGKTEEVLYKTTQLIDGKSDREGKKKSGPEVNFGKRRNQRTRMIGLNTAELLCHVSEKKNGRKKRGTR